MKKIRTYIVILLLTVVAVSCFDENDFSIPDDLNWVGFKTNSFEIAEDSGEGVTAEIIVSSAKLTSDLSITYTVSSSNATEGVDYSLPSGSGTITVPKGSNSVNVVLIESALNNDNVTGDRTIVFEITSTGGLTLGGPDGFYGGIVTVVVAEDDFTTFGYTSFEDIDLTGLSANYNKSGSVELLNNPGEAPVDFVATGNELGFNTSFLPEYVGDPGVEVIGVNNGAFGGYTYPFGSQGYAASDLDGALEIVFDEVTIPPGISVLRLDIAAYFIDGGDWQEEGNGIELIWRTAGGDETVINIRRDDGIQDVLKDMDGNSVNLAEWLFLKGRVMNTIMTGRPVLRIENDNNADLILVDMVIAKGF